MKYCSYCGEKLLDEAEICTCCGCRVARISKADLSDKPIKGNGLGFVLSFFLGLIGFLVALFLGDEDCKKMATKTFVACLIIKVVLVVLYIGVVAYYFSYYY